MPLRTAILTGLNHLLARRGFELHSRPAPRFDHSLDAGLARLARLVPTIGTVIDVGAAAGTWTRRSLPHFPQARHLLVEPLQERQAELERLRRAYPVVEFVQAAAGEQPGEVALNVAADLDSSGIYDAATGNSRTVPLTTIDAEVAARSLPAPFFLKLDTHGFEVPILTGAARTLEKTAVLMIEAYNFKIAPPGLRFHELCAWLEGRGFRPADLLEPMRRPGDEMLWQMDLVFLRHDHPAFASSTYR